MNVFAIRFRHAFRALSAAAAMLAAASAQAGTIWSFGGCVANDCSGPEPNAGFVAVAAGNYHGMGLRSDGSIVTWGLCDIGQCDVPQPNIGYEAIAAGDSHSLALRDGVIYAWGGEYGAESVPQPNSGYVAIAAGLLHSIALREDGSVVTWGFNPGGGGTPLPVPNSGFIAIAGSGWESLALRADGSVEKWGCGGAGCEEPVPNEGFVAISGHFGYSLAIRGADGAIVGWGSAANGELDVPEPNSGFAEVAAGTGFALGRRSDGSVVAWGNPVMMPALNQGFTDISANGGIGFGVQSLPCHADADCYDGLWCNGDETCLGSTCQPGIPRCAEPDSCRESDQRCVECLLSSQCDDALFCNGAETCGPDGTCQDNADPCVGIGCDEAADTCVTGVDTWLSFTSATSVPGLGTVADEDIVSYNLATGTWSVVFDGSDVGLSGFAIDGMARWYDNSILLSFTEAGNVPGLAGGPAGAAVDDSDIVRFVPSSLGPATSGSFTFHFDGSDVGLTTDDEDVDAIALTSTFQLVISTLGAASVDGIKGKVADADLLRFLDRGHGAKTEGTFVMYFDGSDVGLSDAGEDVDAADIRKNGKLLLSTLGTAAVPGLSAADEDVLQFAPTSLGDDTSGSYGMFLDLTTLGIPASANVGSVDLIE